MRKILIAGFAVVAGMSLSVPAARAGTVAGLSNYSYVQVQRVEWGNSRYFGDSAKGNGAEFSFQFGQHAFFFGNFDRLAFDHSAGYLYQTGVGLGYQQTQGNMSAYLRAGIYRRMLSGALGGARSYYWRFEYGMTRRINQWVSAEGSFYSDFRPEFGSRPWGVRAGAVFRFGPVSIHVDENHNREVNSTEAILRVSF